MSSRRHPFTTVTPNGATSTAASSIGCTPQSPKASSTWSDIEGLFRDNELQRVVLLEAEFRSVVQSDLNISDYCTKLKKLSDSLRGVGHLVSEPSQVLNLIRGLNPKFRHVKPVLTSKSHTFMSACSYLLLEELQLQNDDKTEAGHAGGSASGAASGSSFGAGGSSTTDSGGQRGSKPKHRGRGSGNGSASFGEGFGGGASERPPAPWMTNYNP
jgi:hypothetical protein